MSAPFVSKVRLNSYRFTEEAIREVIGIPVFDGFVIDGQDAARYNLNHPNLFREKGFTSIFNAEIGRPKVQDALSNAIDALKEQLDLPPPFIFAASTPWQIARAMKDPASRILGGGSVVLLPDFWAWNVEPGEKGWTPHRDKGRRSLDENLNAFSCTVWVPLTTVTAGSSHIHVLPKDKDPGYLEPSRELEIRFDEAVSEVVPLLAPQRGKILVWDQNVLHWGTRGLYANRKSIAFEYQFASRPLLNRPVYALSPGPTSPEHLVQPLPSTFDERLTLVARQIMQYRHLHPIDTDVEEWARTLLRGKGYLVS